jgi:GNAT superfamily N-acetyltransferase
LSTRILPHDDQGLEPFKEAISDYTEGFRLMGMPYWVFVEGSDPVGVVAVGKEPYQLLAPVGTPLSVIRVLDYEQQVEALRGFATKALAISKENEVDYVSTSVPSKYHEVIGQFQELGFKVLSDSYRMVCPLDGPLEPSSVLRFERVQRKQVRRFIELTKGFMSGSPDIVLNMILENLSNIPEQFLDIWYNLEQLYFAHHEGAVVGILDLNPGEGMINNIGVAPPHRSKGHGRQIMLFGMKTLKQGGLESARLRVHVDNERAIHLYETLGFKVTDRRSTLIWEKESSNQATRANR